MTLPTLYKTNAKGATQVINMTIDGPVYTRTWGQLNGKQQTKATIAKGKNLTRSNETSPSEQAVLEAEAVWTKKQKTGYSTTQGAPIEILLPMKVNDYHKHKKKIKFPCYTSVKLNGVNVEYRIIGDELKLLSRGGEEYPIPPHQAESAKAVLNHLGITSINGEMYCHGEHLQDIMAATKKHNDLTPSLTFWVFDFPTAGGEYSARCKLNYDRLMASRLEGEGLALINVGVANSHEELDEQHALAVANGYEGIIIRNPKGLYKYNTRSLDVFKYKLAQDAEFPVTGFTLDKNGHAVFTCTVNVPLTEPAAGINTIQKEFKVKLRGTHEERLKMAAKADSYIGKHLKVEFETYSRDGVPLKPVGICFRKVDANGEAIE